MSLSIVEAYNELNEIKPGDYIMNVHVISLNDYLSKILPKNQADLSGNYFTVPIYEPHAGLYHRLDSCIDSLYGFTLDSYAKTKFLSSFNNKMKEITNFEDLCKQINLFLLKTGDYPDFIVKHNNNYILLNRGSFQLYYSGISSSGSVRATLIDTRPNTSIWLFKDSEFVIKTSLDKEINDIFTMGYRE